MPKKINEPIKIQVTLPAKTAKEVEQIIKEEGYESYSDFSRYAIQEYIWRKQQRETKAPGGN